MGEDVLDSFGVPSLPGWSVAAESGEQSGTLVGDVSETQVAMTGNAGMLPSADDLARSLTSMTDVKVVFLLPT